MKAHEVSYQCHVITKSVENAREIYALQLEVGQLRKELGDTTSKWSEAYEQLAAAEDLCQQYRDALEKVLTWGNETATPFDLDDIVKEALALPSPKAALNSYVADELERMADGYNTEWVQIELRNRAKELREEK